MASMERVFFCSLFVCCLVLGGVCCSCVSLGDPGEARRGHAAEFSEILKERSAWLDEPRDLSACLSFALENNYSLRLSALERRLSELDVDSSFAEFLPKVSLSGGWTGWRHQQTMRGVATTDKESWSGKLGVEMPLVAPATWLLYANRRLERQCKALSEYLARQEIISQVTTLYYQALLCEIRISVLESQVASTKSQYERVSSLFEEGQVLSWECTNAQAQWRSRELSLEEARRELAVTRGQLLESLGLSPLDSARLRLVYPSEPREAPEESLQDSVLRALARRPELSLRDRLVVESENQVRMALVNFLPTVGGFLNGTWTSDDIADRATNLYGGVSAAMELFRGGEKIASYRSAKVAREAARLQREELSLSVMLEVLSADRDLRDAGSQRTLAQLNYDAAQARYKDFLSRFEEGVEPLYKMLDARAQMDDAHLALVQTAFVKDIALVRLDLATGALTPSGDHWTPEDREHPMRENLPDLLVN